jgi:cation diffusion facilitator CzcD-associated flavoprotein CzcO
VRVFEAGSGVGGTWYWNRYPGARFDSESWTFGYSFSPELLEEWHWQEHFAPQPETERYLNHVADKFDLRRHVQFESRVAAARYQEDTRSWDVTLEDGTRHSSRFLLTAIGILSAPTMPNIPVSALSRGRPAIRIAGPRKGSILPASASGSSAPARRRCRPSRRSLRTSVI